MVPIGPLPSLAGEGVGHDLYCHGILEALSVLVGHDLYCYGSLVGLHGLEGHGLYCYGSLEGLWTGGA